MAKFRDIKTLQKFASVQASIHNHFNHERHLYRREIFKQNRSAAQGRMAAACSLKTLTRGSLQIVRVRLTTPGEALAIQEEDYFTIHDHLHRESAELGTSST